MPLVALLSPHFDIISSDFSKKKIVIPPENIFFIAYIYLSAIRDFRLRRPSHDVHFFCRQVPL